MSQDKLAAMQSHLTIDQYSSIVRFIATNDFSAECMRSYISDLEVELKIIEPDLKKLLEAKGISLIYTRCWNKFQRRSSSDTTSPRNIRTAIQDKIVNKYHPDSLYEQELDFIDGLKEHVETTTEELQHLKQILAVYLELFPEAINSPRAKRSELNASMSKSPARFVKSRSSPVLISPRNSPRTSATSSDIAGSPFEVIQDAFESPRRRSTGHRRSRRGRSGTSGSTSGSRNSSRSRSRSRTRTKNSKN